MKASYDKAKKAAKYLEITADNIYKLPEYLTIQNASVYFSLNKKTITKNIKTINYSSLKYLIKKESIKNGYGVHIYMVGKDPYYIHANNRFVKTEDMLDFIISKNKKKNGGSKILCACGCGEHINEFDKYGRMNTYKKGHNRRDGMVFNI